MSIEINLIFIVKKSVSYHSMDFNGKDVLGVHVQGDKKFSMYKQCGQGDERLIPIYPIYQDTIIRWAKQEVIQAVFEHNDSPSKVSTRKQEFLY